MNKKLFPVWYCSERRKTQPIKIPVKIVEYINA